LVVLLETCESIGVSSFQLRMVTEVWRVWEERSLLMAEDLWNVND
jgi:hypothetical protein